MYPYNTKKDWSNSLNSFANMVSIFMQSSSQASNPLNVGEVLCISQLFDELFITDWLIDWMSEWLKESEIIEYKNERIMIRRIIQNKIQ